MDRTDSCTSPHGDRGRPGHVAIVVILLFALALRFLVAVSLTGAIDPEGAEYARIAENLLAGEGYRGIATPDRELMFPPLFPYLIVAISLLTHQAEFAGRLLSVTMGALLVLPVYLIGLHLYGRAPAYIAAALIAVHPYLISYSSTVYCEPTYLTLVLTGVYWSLRALRLHSTRTFLLAGVFFGLAYLIRPEAALYPFVVFGLAVAYVFKTKRQDLRRVALRSIWMFATFMVLGVPYIVWLHGETGQWRLEGKSPLNYVIRARMLEGASSEEAGYLVDSDLTERGVWVLSNLATIQSFEFRARELGRYVLAQVKNVLIFLSDNISSRRHFGSPPLFALAVLGLFRRPWRRELAVDYMFFLVILGVTGSGLFFIYYYSDRFLLIVLPLLIVWASKGIVELARWASSTMRLICGRFPHSARIEAVTAVVIAAMVPVTTVSGVYSVQAAMKHSQSLKTAGEWLNAYEPGRKVVMDVATILSFHASATFVPFPYADTDVALRYLDKREVNFIVLGDHYSPTSRPYLQDWLESGIPSSRAEVIYSTRTTGTGRIIIYAWHPIETGARTHSPVSFPGKNPVER